MHKNRKSRKEKIKSTQRRELNAFKIKEEWLTSNSKKAKASSESVILGTTFLRQDLTKTFVLTMLVLALELALWLYLSRH